ncbi:hypothetical protein [Streptomyces genisteinicus]|uniref:Uncharacterized protein n=1 Tax=Streptomyces genisteinicus TaxID=2768068 RepID=A0A7H0HV97_9ACTN|nr:hypothetical protein [Streptomyces genisteinicus]QNP64463.1 hypothetical protein IAG43_17120 [Streptomyces genisteinicus]
MNARYLTRAAEITGDHEITVDATFTRNGHHTAECRGCGDTYSIYLYDSKTREWAQQHAETCRAMPATDAV